MNDPFLTSLTAREECILQFFLIRYQLDEDMRNTLYEEWGILDVEVSTLRSKLEAEDERKKSLQN